MTDNGAAAEAHADDVVKASAAPPNAGVHAPAASPSSHASDSAGASGGASSSSSKKKAKKKKKKKKKKRKKIDKEHPEFELTYDMMLGIRTTVSQVESKPPRELTRDDFEESISLRFLAEGTGETPPHKMRDFKFKDYAPQVFRHIRERFDVTPQEYLLNICGDFQFLEFISNSKSGQFFFYSENRQFMIKTISKAESKYLRRILEHYYTHVMDNPNTLLTRFFGMHRVKPHKKPQVHFLILGSVFHRSRFVHRTYDLKGSTQGRITDIPDDKDVATLVLKDNNWLHDDAKIKVGGRSAQLLTEQLASDAQFLCRLNIMDYSLLIGIHYRDRPVPGAEDDSDADDGPDADGADAADEPAPARPASNSRAFARSASERGADALQVPGPDQGRPPLSRRRSDFGRRRSRYGLPSYYDKVSKPEDIKFEAPDFGPLPLPPKEDLPGAQGEVISTVHSLFTADDGGIASEDGTEVYYMGIIDILVDYGVTKRLEHGFKSIKYNSRTISAVHPQVYAERFKEFLFKSIE